MSDEKLLQVINRAKSVRATKLDLGDENITKIPAEIKELDSLIWLNLGGNKLTNIPEEIINLKKLQVLLLYDNEISELPKEIVKLRKLTSLNLDGNPLPIPKEILSDYSNPQKIINYYFKSLSGEPINQCKLVVVGEANVGKTCLINRLIYNKFEDTKSTQGIKIHHWENEIEVNNKFVHLNVWDFGGQEIMHSTHQFFFTKRTIYILVINARENYDSEQVNEWLKRIDSLGGDSPIIIVGNKIDENNRTSNPKTLGDFEINRAELLNKYPNIKGFYGVCCDVEKKQYDNLFQDFKEGLIKEIGNLKEVHKLFPINWFTVKRQLEKMTEENIPFIHYFEYVRRCIKANIEEDIDQKTLVEFLHDLGIVLSFHNDSTLRETMVFNPEWVTRGVYSIIDNPTVRANKGILNQFMFSEILDEEFYPPEQHKFIIELMKKFELCVDIYNNETFLIPDLLPLEEDYTGNWDNSLQFQFHYENYLKSIFTRFIVKIYPYIRHNIYWRNGVNLEYEGAEALVKVNIPEGKILIFIKGRNTNKRRELLAIIRERIKEINHSFANLPYKEKIAHPKYTNILRDYNRLLAMEDNDILEEFVEELELQIPVKEWLDGVESPEERQIRRGYNIQKEKKIIKQKEGEIEQLEEELETKKKQISEIQALANRFGKLTSSILIITFSILFTSAIFFALYFKLTLISILFSLILFLIPLFVSFIKGKEWSFTKHTEQVIEQEKKNLCEKFNIDIQDFESKEKLLVNLKRELEELKNLIELELEREFKFDTRKLLDANISTQENNKEYRLLGVISEQELIEEIDKVSRKNGKLIIDEKIYNQALEYVSSIALYSKVKPKVSIVSNTLEFRLGLSEKSSFMVNGELAVLKIIYEPKEKRTYNLPEFESNFNKIINPSEEDFAKLINAQ